MIKIAHEAPLALMELVQNNTDYDYSLVHLLKDNPKYFNFFKKSLEMGREVILDNGIFELGKAFDVHEYRRWIGKLQPTYYIIPDVLEDCNGTIESAKYWFDELEDWSTSPGEPIGVVQGRTYGELVKCYIEMDKVFMVNKIAISFDYSYYLEVAPFPNKWVSYMMGRVLTLNRMLKDGVINTKKPHHLLGCAHPREFSFYTAPEFNWIKTLDTSSPVIHGLKEISYSDEIGTWVKETIKVAEWFNMTPTPSQINLVTHNIHKFREFLNVYPRKNNS